MVWEVATPQRDVSLPRPEHPVLLHDVLPYADLDLNEDALNLANSDHDDDLEAQNDPNIDALSQASVSMDISDPPTPRAISSSRSTSRLTSPERLNLPRRHPQDQLRQPSPRRTRPPTRSSTRSRPRSPSTDSNEEAPLPATALAHFLATQLLSVDPAQTLLELTQSAPGAPPPLLETLRQRENGEEVPPPTNRLSLRAGLDHIQSHFGPDKQLPNVISNSSIERPAIVYTAEELQYL